MKVQLSLAEHAVLEHWLLRMHWHILSDLKLEWGYDKGSVALVINQDEVAARAARIVANFYPPAVLDRLHNKATICAYLGEAGFPVLFSTLVHSVHEIGAHTNFILKPPFAQAGVYQRIGGVSYKRFADVADLLSKHERAAVDRQIAGGYVLQQADMRPEQTEIALRGVINSRSRILWCRDSGLKRTDGRFTKVTRSFDGYGPEKAKLQRFVSGAHIRNASFLLILIRMPDGQLYPIDWNFRLGSLFLRHCYEINYRELQRAIAHQFDVATTLPDVFPGTWTAVGDWISGPQRPIVT